MSKVISSAHSIRMLSVDNSLKSLQYDVKLRPNIRTLHNTWNPGSVRQATDWWLNLETRSLPVSEILSHHELCGCNSINHCFCIQMVIPYCACSWEPVSRTLHLHYILWTSQLKGRFPSRICLWLLKTQYSTKCNVQNLTSFISLLCCQMTVCYHKILAKRSFYRVYSLVNF